MKYYQSKKKQYSKKLTLYEIFILWYNFKTMKKIYDEEGKLFAELNYSENYYLNYSKHSHDSLAFSVFSHGNIEVVYHDIGEVEVNSKQVIVYNPHQVHVTKSKKKNVKNYYTLHIDSTWVKEIQDELFSNKDCFIYLQNIIDEKSIYEKIYELSKAIYFDKELELEKLKELIKEIIEKYTLLEEKENKEEPELIKKVEEYINKNIEEQISLEDISKAVSYDESYITRVFKKKYGLTPHAYIINKRVQKAKEKLALSKDVNLAQLSNEVGFYDQSHFSKVFKKVFAMTPNKYRKQ